MSKITVHQPFLERLTDSDFNAFSWKIEPNKDDLISESFSPWLKCPKKVPNYSPEHLLYKCMVLRAVIWPKKWRFDSKWVTFEIKPPLESTFLTMSHLYHYLSFFFPLSWCCEGFGFCWWQWHNKTATSEICKKDFKNIYFQKSC